jgi:hypothetical protein
MNAMPVPVLTPEPAPPPMSEASRIANTFFAPSKTFSDLRTNASWWAPWLLISLISLIFIYSMDRNVGFDQISKNEIAKSSRAEQFDKLPADQQARQLRISTAFTRYISYATPLIILIAFMVMAGVLMGTFNLAAGASIPFKVAVAIVAYGSLPGVLGAVLGTISVVVGGMSGSIDKEAFNVRNPVASNLAYFLDPAGSKFAYSLATAVDVFMIWNIVVMGIGFACNSKVKRGTSIGIVAGWYLFYKLVGAGLAAVFA